jgi:hypothetical protein
MSAQKDNDEDVLPIEEILDEEITLDADLLSEDDTDLLESELLPDEDEDKTISEDTFLDDLLGPEEGDNFLLEDNLNPYLTDEMTDFLNDRITDYSAISKNAGKQNVTAGKNLNKVRGIAISVAKKEDILLQSHGEILISETINYRTQKPER